MANLRTNKITSTEVFETTGSIQFDGSGDYLTLASSNDFAFGTGDFTVESWVYQTEDNTYPTLFEIGEHLSPSGIVFITKNSGSAKIYSGGFYGSATFSLGSWNHIAFVRSSGNLLIFVNGVLGSTTAFTNNLTDVNFIVLGSSLSLVATSNYYFNGHISNLRILKGTALYTENFTPPTRELEVIPNTVLLCAQSKTRANEEKTGKTITVVGNTVANELTPGLLTNVVKSGGSSAITGSVEFDGTGDYLTIPNSEDFNFGSGNFTIEFWAKANTISGQFTGLIGKWFAGLFGDWYVSLNGFNSTGKFFFQYNNGSGSPILVWDAPTDTNSWSHYAVVRSGTTLYGFKNGIQLSLSSGSSNISTSTITSQNVDVYVGTTGTADGGTYYNGFISNLRIVKGTALYTSNFIPPTRKLTKIPGTVLLCCTDTNNPTAEATGKTITGYGNFTKSDGVELVTNGTFDTNISGWTDNSGSGSSISWSSGRIYLDGTVAYAKADQQITTVPGKTYIMSARVSEQSASEYSELWVGTAVNTANLARKYSPTGYNGVMTVVFTATTTTTWIRLYSGWTVYFDNVSVTAYGDKKGSNFVPQVGSDGSVEFAGPTKINTPNYFYLPTGSTEQRGRGRGVFGGGYSGGNVNVLQYINTQSTGNAIDFGDLTLARRGLASCSSATRGVWGGGTGGTPDTFRNIIDYITIASTGNAQDFGDLIDALRQKTALSNSNRGIFAGGYNPLSVNVIEYITISSKGESQDFGDLSSNKSSVLSCSSPVRGIFAGGNSSNNVIEYITINSTGNAVDFGDLITVRSFTGGCSSSTRGIFGAGFISPGFTNSIEYITISSTGNAQDFGDVTVSRSDLNALSASTKGFFGGGYTPTVLNIIDYVTISTTGNASDFGDLLAQTTQLAGCSDSHGGLG